MESAPLFLASFSIDPVPVCPILDDAGRLVKPETIDLMTAKPNFANAEDAEMVASRANHYGFVVNVGLWEGRQVLSHSGGQSGTSTMLVLLPSEELAISIMTNLGGLPDRQDLVYGIAEIVLEG